MNIFAIPYISILQLQQLSTQEIEIKDIVKTLNELQNVRFSEQWIDQLLSLFSCKEEIQLFWTLLSQSYIDYEIDQSNPFIRNVIQSNLDTAQNEDNDNKNIFPLSGFSDRRNINNRPSNLNQFEGLKRSLKQNTRSMKQNIDIPEQIREKIRQQYKLFKNCEIDRFNVPQIAAKHNINKSQVYKLFKQLENQPQFQTFRMNSEEAMWKNQKGTLSRQMQEWKREIQLIVQRNPYLTLAQIQKKIEEKGDKVIPHVRTIKKLLTSMRYTKRRLCKEAEDKNTAENMKIRQKYCELYAGILRKEDLKVYFVDELKFYLKDIPDYAWAKVNNHLPSIKNSTFVKLFAAVSSDGSFFWEITNSLERKQASDISFIEKLFEKIWQSWRSNTVIILGNNMTASRASIKEIAYKRQWKMMMLPPKSEELNPISYLTTQIKNLYSSSIHADNLIQLELTIANLCQKSCQWKKQFVLIKKYAEQIGSKTGRLQ